MASFDPAVARFVQQQKLYQAALAGILAQCLARPDARYGSARAYLQHATGEAYRTVDAELVTGLHSAGGAAMLQGIEDAKRSLAKKNQTALTDIAAETVSETIADIRGVLLRDRETVRRVYQRFAIESTLTGAGQGAAALLARGKLDTLQFRQPDRIGRMWDSGVYARALYRQTLLWLEVESCLYTMVKGGRDLAVAEWDDGRHSIVFSISGKSPGNPSYLSLKDALFHPNSTATVRPK